MYVELYVMFKRINCWVRVGVSRAHNMMRARERARLVKNADNDDSKSNNWKTHTHSVVHNVGCVRRIAAIVAANCPHFAYAQIQIPTTTTTATSSSPAHRMNYDEHVHMCVKRLNGDE